MNTLSAPAPKKTNKIWIVVVLLILCCLCSLVGVVVGYFYFQNNAAGIGEIFPLVQPSNETKPGEEIRCETGGYAFKMPPGYKAFPAFTINCYYSLAQNDNFSGMFATIGLEGIVPSNETFEMYEGRFRLFAIPPEGILLSEPQVTVAGLKGIALEYEFDHLDLLTGAVEKGKGRQFIVEVNPKQFFWMTCFSPIKIWDKTLATCDAVVNSITFFEPVPSPTQTP